LWLAGSAAFSFYAENFGSYDRTYGSLGAVAALLVWLYVTAYIILAGAELNREIGQAEHEAEWHLQRQNARTGVPPVPKKIDRPKK
jgi:membrane protein